MKTCELTRSFLIFHHKTHSCDSIMKLGRHERTCYRARKGHSRSLKSANEQKIFVDKLPFPSCLAQHVLKLLARISLRDVRNLC